MKMYLSKSVWDAAIERIEWLFEEFENIYVGFSGGKDSTVIFNLAMQVAERRGRLPLKVMFIDQEAEWQMTIDYIRTIMNDPRVEPYWFQIPFRISNATSTNEDWLYCWEEGAEWMRPKEPNAITKNVFDTITFADLFTKILGKYHPNEKACYIGGVRTEESPARYCGLTMYETYKGETWGKYEDKEKDHFVFYPIYDWSYKDVWKAINDNGWPYCKIYDYMYQYGLPVRQMRVSNIHHGEAVKTLYYVQEVEAETWSRATKRLKGINTVGQMQEQFLRSKELPFMFATWEEYRDHLLENLIDEVHKPYFRKTFAAYDSRYEDPKVRDQLVKTEIAALLVNDYFGTKLDTFRASHSQHSKNRGKISGRTNDNRR